MLNKEQIYQIIDFVVNEAKGYDTRILVGCEEEGFTRFANSEIHQNMYQDSTNITITILHGKKRSEIRTNLYSEEGLRAAVKDAIANLEFLPEGEMELPLVQEPKLIEDDSFNPALAEAFGTKERALLIKGGIDKLEPGFKAYGALSHMKMALAFGNSAGVKRYSLGNTVDFSVLISKENGGSSYTELTSTSPDDLDIVGAFAKVFERAKMNQNPQPVELGAYTVILEPLAVGEILTYLAYVGFSAKSVQDQYSFLSGKKGQKIFDEKVTIVDDYTDENTLRLPFDFEGFPRKKVTIIDRGVAKDLVYDQMSAIKDGVESTGHSTNNPGMGGFPINLVISAGDQSLEEMIKNTENGLLITRFNYMNVISPRQITLTALTRDGVFKIENGKIVGAVKNMRFTEGMLNAFNNVVALSSERSRTKGFFGNYYVPSMKINDFHFTGKTEA